MAENSNPTADGSRIPFLPNELLLEVANHATNYYLPPRDNKYPKLPKPDINLQTLKSFYTVNRLFNDVARKKMFACVAISKKIRRLFEQAQIIGQEHIARHIVRLGLRLRVSRHEKADLKGPREDKKSAIEHWKINIRHYLQKILVATNCRGGKLQELKVWTSDSRHMRDVSRALYSVIIDCLSKIELPHLLKIHLQNFPEGAAALLSDQRNASTTLRRNWRRIQILDAYPGDGKSDPRARRTSESLQSWIKTLDLRTLEFIETAYLHADTFASQTHLVKLCLHYINLPSVPSGLSSIIASVEKTIRDLTFWVVNLDQDLERWTEVLQTCWPIQWRDINIVKVSYLDNDQKCYELALICTPHREDDTQMRSFYKMLGARKYYKGWLPPEEEPDHPITCRCFRNH